jgi:hypothetical protein
MGGLKGDVMIRILRVCVTTLVAGVLGFSAHASEDVETVSGDVSLGSSLFTVEDLENFDAACTLMPEQKEAALELMRGAMSRARSMSLKSMRGWQDMDWSEEQADMAKAMEEFQDRAKKQGEEVLKLEKEVMVDLKSLLESAQVGEGWTKFERSRRRLLVRGAHFVLAQARSQVGEGDEDNPMHMMHAFGGDQGVIDVVAMVRASKLTPDEIAPLADTIETYETSLDSLVTSWRPFARAHGNSRSMFFWVDPSKQAKPSKGDVEQMGDVLKRMCQLQVRTSRKIEETLTGAALERFQRQRLRREMRWQWQPAKRTPEIIAVLRLRSLTADQKSGIDELLKKADSELLKFSVENLHKMDEKVLLDKEPEESDMYGDWGPEQHERVRQEQKLRRSLTKDVLALLSPDQRAAYDTGIENEQDLAQAFEKRRRESNSPWEIDQDLNPWMDVWQAHQEEEE